MITVNPTTANHAMIMQLFKTSLKDVSGNLAMTSATGLDLHNIVPSALLTLAFLIVTGSVLWNYLRVNKRNITSSSQAWWGEITKRAISQVHPRYEVLNDYDLEHVNNSKALILKGAKDSPKDSVTILGVGEAREIDLIELCKRFERVNIVDIDRKAIKRALATVPVDMKDNNGQKLREKINVYEVDITGGQLKPFEKSILALIDMATSRADLEKRIKKPFEDLRLTVPEELIAPLRASYVISSQVMTQLPIGVDQKIYDHYFVKFNEKIRTISSMAEGLALLEKKVYQQHVQLLSDLIKPDGKIYFAADVIHGPELKKTFKFAEFALLVDKLNSKGWFNGMSADDIVGIKYCLLNYFVKDGVSLNDAERFSNNLLYVAFNAYNYLGNTAKYILFNAITDYIGNGFIDEDKARQFVVLSTELAGKINRNTMTASSSFPLESLFSGQVKIIQGPVSWTWINYLRDFSDQEGGVYQVQGYILEKANSAMSVKAVSSHLHTEGGINLNPAQLSMQVKHEGEDFKFNFNGAKINAAQISGAVFTINSITAVTNLSEILGLKQ